jgi:hypothetical protein
MKPVRLQVPSLQPNRAWYFKRGRDSTPNCPYSVRRAIIDVIEVDNVPVGSRYSLLLQQVSGSSNSA